MVKAQWGRPKEEGRRYDGTRVNPGICQIVELLELKQNSLFFVFLKCNSLWSVRLMAAK